ncbi:hypothetical protein D3C87_1566810 [compost metagenome]
MPPIHALICPVFGSIDIMALRNINLLYRIESNGVITVSTEPFQVKIDIGTFSLNAFLISSSESPFSFNMR